MRKWVFIKLMCFGQCVHHNKGPKIKMDCRKSLQQNGSLGSGLKQKVINCRPPEGPAELYFQLSPAMEKLVSHDHGVFAKHRA